MTLLEEIGAITGRYSTEKGLEKDLLELDKLGRMPGKVILKLVILLLKRALLQENKEA